MYTKCVLFRNKIIIVRIDQKEYRRTIKEKHTAEKFYRKYPAFAKKLDRSNEDYNRACDEIDRLEEAGRCYVIAPSEPVTVGRLEKDMEKLGALYWLGYQDTKNSIDDLKVYLEME